MRKVSLRQIAPDWRTIVSALLIVLSFPPFDLYFLIWFALVPWFFVLHGASTPRRALVQGLWLSFLMTLGGFSWVAFVLHQFAGLPWAVAIIGLLLFGLICQPQFLIFAPAFTFFHKRLDASRRTGLTMLAAGAFFALTYSGVDWILPKLFVDTLGHSFYQAHRLRQAADIGGAHLLTFIVLLVNYAIWWLALNFQQTRRRGVWQFGGALPPATPLLIVAAIASGSAWIYGSTRYSALQGIIQNPVEKLQAAVIQGNIGDIEKLASEKGIRSAAEKVVGTLLGMSDHALSTGDRKPDVVIWPETSYPSTFRTPQTPDELARDQLVERFVQERQIPLLFGGYDRMGGEDFNSLFFLHPQPVQLEKGETSDQQVYHKNILLLFGEYIPGMEHIQFLKDLFPQIGNFGRGEGPEVFNVPLAPTPEHPDRTDRVLKTGPIICYEALFPNYVIDAARMGSQMILNITNDSWFGPYQEPQLHLSLVIFRSIETRLPQLRSTNTGISALILPDGTISHQTRIGEPEIMNVSVPLIAPVSTLMLKWGDWFGPHALALGLLGSAFLLWRRKE